MADGGSRVIAGSRDLSDPDDRYILYILRIEVAHAARWIKHRNEVFRQRGRTTGGRRHALRKTTFVV